jgi:hypothetical protein
MDRKEIGWEVVDWIHLARDPDQCRALENKVNEPSNSMKGKEFLS